MEINILKLISDKDEIIVEHFYEDEKELIIIDSYKDYKLPKGEFNGIKELKDFLTSDGKELNYLMLTSKIDTDEFKSSTDYLKTVGLDVTNFLLENKL